jgi:hypothetical protein
MLGWLTLPSLVDELAQLATVRDRGDIGPIHYMTDQNYILHGFVSFEKLEQILVL